MAHLPGVISDLEYCCIIRFEPTLPPGEKTPLPKAFGAEMQYFYDLDYKDSQFATAGQSNNPARNPKKNAPV
jgi:hypothetical protein